MAYLWENCIKDILFFVMTKNITFRCVSINNNIVKGDTLECFDDLIDEYAEGFNRIYTDNLGNIPVLWDDLMNDDELICLYDDLLCQFVSVIPILDAVNAEAIDTIKNDIIVEHARKIYQRKAYMNMI